MAGSSINRIAESDRNFSVAVSSSWQGSSATLMPTLSISRYSGGSSISTNVTTSSIIYFNKDSASGLPLNTTCKIDKTIDIGNSVVGFFWIKSSVQITIDFSVQLLFPADFGSGTVAATQTETISVTSGEWTLIRPKTPTLVPNDAFDYSIALVIEPTFIDGASADIYISHPCVYGFFDILDNTALTNVYKKLPEFVRYQDNQTSIGNWQLARFLEMCLIHYGEINQLVNDFIYSDISLGYDENDYNTKSTLIDPDVVDISYLPWLAQFSGTRLINPTTGITPWVNLPATWDGIGDITAPLNDDSAPWNDIQDYDPLPVGLEDFLRWQVKHGYYGVNAGTKTAIIESVKRVLSGTKNIAYAVTGVWGVRIDAAAAALLAGKRHLLQRAMEEEDWTSLDYRAETRHFIGQALTYRASTDSDSAETAVLQGVKAVMRPEEYFKQLGTQ